MAETNLSATTRDLFLSSVHKALFLRIALLARLVDANQVSWEGGENIKAPVDMAEMDDLAQAYTVNETLNSGSKTLLQTPKFGWKYVQVPMKYTVEELVANTGSGETQIVNFVEYLAKKGMRGARLKLLEMMYAAGSSTCDTDAEFQSVPDALTHDITYGNKERADTTTNKWWQGASGDGTYTDWDTAIAPTINNFRMLADAIALYTEMPGDLLAITSHTNFRRLKSQVEAQRIYNPGRLAKYGFNSMEIDGIEVVAEPYLEQDSDRKKYFMLINIPDWEFRVHPSRAFKVTDFKWQGDVPNGLDEFLGRVMLAGNLVCWRPSASLFRSNMS